MTVAEFTAANPDWMKRGRLRVITDEKESVIVCGEIITFSKFELVKKISEFEVIEEVPFS